ncbi:hypothetical protein EHS25_008126 [Saitozyma podzolica]|uniref:Transcription factor domain-containing protein n=1 Tax=Saitozyma podzolica TaxID=1890683 RepID=A0A427YNP7_9TREE|nr:hypothetical protein EHS25_008126 [Saitozyma podzolica]
MSDLSHKDDIESAAKLQNGHPTTLASGINGAETSPPLSSTALGDPTAQYTRLLSIRAEILRFAHTWAYGTPVSQRQALSAFASHRQMLRSWRDELPANLEIKGRPLPALSQATQLAELFSIHLWYLSSYCDLCVATLSTVLEAARRGFQPAAPPHIVQAIQDDCVENAAEILRLSNLVLTNYPTFVSRDRRISVCLYQAIRITVWDLFRHPSPSTEMKRSTVALARGALIHLGAMAEVFPSSACRLGESLKLLENYGFTRYLIDLLPPEVFDVLSKAAGAKDDLSNDTAGQPG